MERGLAPRPQNAERGGRQLAHNARPEQGSSAGAGQPRNRPWSNASGARDRGRQDANWRRRSGRGCQRPETTAAQEQLEEPDSVECELGFYYEPNDRKAGASSSWRRGLSGPSGQRGGGRQAGRRWTDADPGAGFYNKEIFMQANCQFVVKAAAADGPIDYTAYTKDPDLLVNWELVEEVRAPVSDAQCPICLYPPKAAKVAKCGHVYCYPCALQYISYENERRSKKCAICAEHMYPGDLRSILPLGASPPALGEEIEMLLMRKVKGDTRVAPVESFAVADDEDKNSLLLPVSADERTKFSKLLTATAAETEQRIIGRELAELAEARRDAGADESGLLYIEAALREILARRSSLAALSAAPTPGVGQPPQRLSAEAAADVAGVAANDAVVDEDEEAASPEPELAAGAPPRRAKLTSVTEDPTQYFYQSADGRHVYLHAINWQCLVWQYGSMADCPGRIRARVAGIEHATVTAALRKRLAYLRHLPLACGIVFVELQLGQPLLSRETLRQFAPKLEQRRRHRLARAREEKHLSRQRDIEEKRLMGLAEDVVITASAMRLGEEAPEDPTFTDADPPLPPPRQQEQQQEQQQKQQEQQEQQQAETSAGMSFAQVTRATAQAPVWPALSQRQQQQQQQQQQQTGQQQAAEDSEEASAPRPQLNMGDALGALIDAQLQQQQQRQLNKKKRKKKLRSLADELADS